MSLDFEEPFTLYEDLQSELLEDREFINEKLLINTKFQNDINSTGSVIDAIYDSIERNAAGYSFSEYCFKQLDKDLISELTPKIFILRSYNPENVKNYRNDLKKKNDISFTDSNEFAKKELLIYEDAIKSHCIMKALYTVTYLLNKDITMTSPQLGFVAKNKGMNELNPIKIKKASKNIPKSDLEVWKNIFDSTLNTTFQSQLALLYKYKSGKYERRKACFFLSDFSYDIVKNQGKINSFHLENKLRSIVNNFHLSNKRLFNRHTKDFAEKYDKFCKEYMNCTSSNIIDNFLFYYKKELSFGHDLLCSFFQNSPINGLSDYTFSNSYHNIALCEIDEKNELLKLGLSLPNVFSRAYFMRTLIPKDMKDSHALNECKDKLLYLINIVFPIFERAFFISLFDHAKSIDEDNPLKLMKTYLEEYIAKNYLRVTRNGYFARSSNPNNIISWASLVIDKSYYNLFYGKR